MTKLIDLIAAEIDKNRDAAQDFVLEIYNILGGPVDLDQILSVLREIKRHGKRVTTPQIVAVYFDSALPSPPKKLKEKHLSHQAETELEEIFLSRDILEQSNLDTPRIIPPPLQSLQSKSSQQPHLKPISSQPPQKLWKEEKSLPKQIKTELEELFLGQDSLQQSTLNTPHINPPSLQSLQQKKQLSVVSTSSQSLEKPQKGKKEESTSPESLNAVSPNPPLTRRPTGKIAQIASELQADVETANNFVKEVQRLLGKSIKFKEILNVLRQLKGTGQISPEKIVSVLQSEEKPIVQKEQKNSKTINIGRVISIPIETKNQKHKILPSRRPPIFQIAEKLGVNKQEAQKFMAQVDKEYGTTVAFKKVLEVLKQIDNPQSVTPQVIAALLPPRKPAVTSPPIQPTVPPPVSEKSVFETTSTAFS